MSDIFTSYSSCTFADQTDNDNLVEFLTKLAQFGIDQCLHFANLIITKQRSFQNCSTFDHKYKIYEDKRIDLNQLLMEIQTVQDEFYNILLIISSSDDKHKQLLFIRLQNYLSTFVEINLRFKSFEISTNEIHHSNRIQQSTNTFELSKKEKSHESLSTITCLSNQPSIAISSSFFLNDDINNNNTNIDLGKYWKFANIIHTRFEMSLIASNSHMILCYNNQNSILHFILITGQFQGNIKWKHDPIIDIHWCSSIDRYLALTRHSIYIIQYNQLKLSSSNPIVVNKIVDLEKFNTARITSNENNILLYTTYQQKGSIQIYDNQFKKEKIFNSLINQQLPTNSRSFCCTNTLIALTEQNETLISYFPYRTPKKVSLLLFDIDTFELRYTIDLNDCSSIYTMKCHEKYNIFFGLSNEKTLWIVKINHDETIQMAKKVFYTDQTEMCMINNQDLLLINSNAGHAIQLIKYRKIKQ